jgi:membrane protease YdiL (CAAX protease family)
MYWDYAIIFVTLGALVPLLGRRRVERILKTAQTTQRERLRLYASTVVFQWTLTAVVLWRGFAHEMSHADFGLALPRPWLTAIISVGLVGLLLLNQIVSLQQVGSNPEQLHGKLAQVALRIFPRDRAEGVAFFGVVTTVAICEEVVFRGFVQGVFQSWSERTLVAVVASAALFSIAHLYQGRRGLIATFIVGVLFSVTRSWTGSLIPCCVGHFAVDFVAGYFLPERLRKALSAASSAPSVYLQLP